MFITLSKKYPKHINPKTITINEIPSMRKLYQRRSVNRKNFLPSLVVTFILWGAVVLTIFLLDPGEFLVLPFFIFLVFLALTFTFSIMFVNTKRGILGALVLTLFLIFRVLGIENLISYALVVILAVIFDRLTSK
jgi:hypothetical protein